MIGNKIYGLFICWLSLVFYYILSNVLQKYVCSLMQKTNNVSSKNVILVQLISLHVTDCRMLIKKKNRKWSYFTCIGTSLWLNKYLSISCFLCRSSDFSFSSFSLNRWSSTSLLTWLLETSTICFSHLSFCWYSSSCNLRKKLLCYNSFTLIFSKYWYTCMYMYKYPVNVLHCTKI